jgi:hypothetical protein
MSIATANRRDNFRPGIFDIVQLALISFAATGISSGALIQGFESGTISPGSSSYTNGGPCVPGGPGIGAYSIDNDASICNGAWFPTGPQAGDFYMIVDGALEPDSTVYSQTVAVIPGASYTLSLWVAGLFSELPATLRIDLVGGSPASKNLGETNTTGIWERKSIDSVANAASLTFSVVDLSSDFVGNDFGIDTIELAEIPEPPTPVPEQATALLAGTALLVLVVARRTF